jgi:hypothetical protein
MSTGGSGGSGTGGTMSTGGSGGSGTGGSAGGSAGAGGMVGSCATTGTKANCESCCQTTNKAGYDFLISTLVTDCACKMGAPCQTDCADNVCMGGAVSMACQACLSAAGMAKPPNACVTDVQTACIGNADCVAWATCDGGCKNLP